MCQKLIGKYMITEMQLTQDRQLQANGYTASGSRQIYFYGYATEALYIQCATKAK